MGLTFCLFFSSSLLFMPDPSRASLILESVSKRLSISSNDSRSRSIFSLKNKEIINKFGKRQVNFSAEVTRRGTLIMSGLWYTPVLAEDKQDCGCTKSEAGVLRCVLNLGKEFRHCAVGSQVHSEMSVLRTTSAFFFIITKL